VIGLSVPRPEFLLLLLLLPLMAAAWWRWPPPLPVGRSRLVLGSRLLMVTLLAVALAGVRLETPPQRRALVAVVDVSDSVKVNGSLDREAALVRQLEASKAPQDLFGIVTFAHTAEVELPPTQNPPPFLSFTTQPDPSYTDIGGALQLAAGLMPDGYAHQLVLISDGQQNLGDAASAVAALRAEGIRVDVIPVGRAPAHEAMVTGVEAPNQINLGATATVTVNLQSTGPAAGHLTLLVDGQQVASRPVSLPAGASVETFAVPNLGVGLHDVEAELDVQPDTYAQNNVGEAAIRVVGRPLVLVLEGKAGEAANVAAALQAAGMQVDVRQVEDAPTDTASLGEYDSIVLVDTPATSFPTSSMQAIADAVHDLGKGLVAIGGPSAYGPGGWAGTPLETALPVQMQIPNRKQKPKVAVVLVMETMEDPAADQVVLGAAEDVVNQLSPQDEVAVTDGMQGFAVPMTPVVDKKSIDQKLQNASLGDPPGYLTFLQMAYTALEKTDASIKHIIVLGDGDAQADPPQAVQSFLQQAQAHGVTTSAVGVDVHGVPQFMTYMQDIARWGGGQFYESESPSEVPQIFLQETQTSLRPWFEQEAFEPRIAAPGDLLEGVDTTAFPELGGYVVTTAKPSAAQYLISPQQDPVLAAWSYGLGRSVAWTSDAEGIWTSNLLRSPVSAQLFARMVGWTLPEQTQGLQIVAQPSGDGLALEVSGQAVNGAQVQVSVIRPDLADVGAPVVEVAPGRWEGRVTTSTVGIYLIHAALQHDGQVLAQGDAAVALPYSPEYLELGRDLPFLRELAKDGGGIVLTSPPQAWSLPPPPLPVSTDIFWPLLLIAVVLWPLDVAMRRITLSPRQVAANAAALLRERRAPDLEVEVPEELVRLRERVIRARRRGAVGPHPETPPGQPVSGLSRSATAPQKPAVSEGERRREEPEEVLSARLLEARRRRQGRGG
jgi:Ca-activated chloride channel family protein